MSVAKGEDLRTMHLLGRVGLIAGDWDKRSRVRSLGYAVNGGKELRLLLIQEKVITLRDGGSGDADRQVPPSR